MTALGNIPRPLANAPIPLLGDVRSQLSFGERAAIEGILAQLRPDLSIEVGSATGGMLERIARRSRRVHSFDLVEPDAEIAALPNVRLHTGSSHELLTPFLQTLGDSPVDFALIDGDHTTSGVRDDLLNLLDADACARTLILLHDTANSGVRHGIKAGLEHEKVVYHDLDFVGGYTFAEGSFKGQQWGGLGLIVTGDPACDGYGRDPAQNLYQRMF